MSYDNEIDSLPPQLHDIVERELEPDENLVWCGQPKPGLFLFGVLPVLLFGIPWTLMSLVFCSFAINGIKNPDAELRIQIGALLMGSTFLLIGLALCSLPLFLRKHLKKIIYAITDRRAIVFVGTKIVSFLPDDPDKIRHHDGLLESNNVLFDESTPAAHATRQVHRTLRLMAGQSATNGFLNIPQPKKVERLLKDLAAKAPQSNCLFFGRTWTISPQNQANLLHYITHLLQFDNAESK